MARLSFSQRVKVYGSPCTPANIVTVTTPWGIKVRAHRLIAAHFRHTCEMAAARSAWMPRRIDSYACRSVRGGASTSLHSWALAWDWFDRPLPQAVDVWGPTNAPPEEFRSVFKRAGFTLGADFTGRQDVPHCEWAAALPPPVTPSGPGTIAAIVDIDVPLVKPITTTLLGEATGMKISTYFTDIPAIDKDGRGWFDIPYPLERVISVSGHGSSPREDQGYWPTIVATLQPRGEVTRVTLAGAPSQHVGVWWKLLEAE